MTAPSNRLNAGVVGLGNWGTALANHLAMEGHDVLGWSVEEPVVQGINEEHVNPVYQSEIKLDPKLRATGDLEALFSQQLFLLVIPSHVLSVVIPKLHIPDGSILVSAVKGLDADSLLTPIEYVEKNIPAKNVKLVALSGPSFARDVVAGKPCSIVSASKSNEAAETVAEIFSRGPMRVYTSSDPIGVEVGAVVKNVIALAAGVADGVGYGDSARAGLITRGLAEMTRLAVAMGGNSRTLAGLSGLGDLLMTATCDTSRNRTVGMRLGKGESLEHIIKTLGSVAEGVKTTPLVLKLAEKWQVEMPITLEVSKILNGEATPQDGLENLLSRPIKREFVE